MLHQHERVPNQYILSEDPASLGSAPSIKLQSTDEAFAQSFDFSFEMIRPNVFRTTFSSRTHPIPPYPSAQRPDVDLPVDSIKAELDPEDRIKTIDTGNVKAVVGWSNAPVVSLFLDGQHKALHSDLHFRSYAVDDTGIAHYTTYKKVCVRLLDTESQEP
jgi:hypothetical protein